MQTAADILAEDGPLSALIPAYSVRSQQTEMAEAIAVALARQASLICEAGTGTGKTFAYLIPAIQSGSKVIVSTGTRHLQDQLYLRDVETVRRALGVAVNVAQLKGRANYLCLHRLRQVEDGSLRAEQATQDQAYQVRLWSQQTHSGDLAELVDLPESAAVRSLVTSTAENCLGQECEYYADCFVYRARQRAIESDITIVNHHLLLADMALREGGYGELLPAADVIIFDEAHQLPELAARFFSTTLSSHQYLELAADCRAGYYQEAADLPEFLQRVDNLENAVRRLRLALGRTDMRVSWQRCLESEAIMEAVRELDSQSGDLHQVLDPFAARGKQLDSCLKRLDGLMTALAVFLDTADSDDVQWLELRGRAFFLHRTPLDVSGTFQEHLAEYDCSCIYTSATLAVNGSFAHFAGLLGLDPELGHTWSSPFDYQSQALLYLPDGLPEPRARDYTEQVVAAAVPVIEASRGHTFFLFTSYRALTLAAGRVRERIDYPVLVQGDAPRTELLETFRHTPHAVLLGTQSFWEGVDVKGRALSCVIIDKLPFGAPDDPVMEARLLKMQQQGLRPFIDYQLPEAVITLKQGVGRLIRDYHDYGVMMICDPRIMSRSYGRVFLRSLPDMPRTHSVDEVQAFFDRFNG